MTKKKKKKSEYGRKIYLSGEYFNYLTISMYTGKVVI